jgi:hypothetical protein
MNPYEGPNGGNFRPDDFDTDMITMNPPRWQRWRPARPIAVAGVAVVALAGGAGVGYAATHSVAKPAANPATVAAAAAAPSPSASAVPVPRSGKGWRAFPGGLPGGPGFPGGMPGGPFRFARGPLGAGLIHGQFTAPKAGGGYQTVDVQQGTVTAVSANSITVKSADGYTFTYTVSNKTVMDAQAAGIGSVKKGDTVFVTATVSGTTATAADILDVTAVKAGRASFGFPVPDRPKDLPSAPVKAPSA